MKLSIITINYNNVEGLRKTIESVFAQKCKNFEYIIVDGASTDGSVDVIHKYIGENAAPKLMVDGIPVVWSSEKDKGIYNAMNKGAQKSIGEYMIFLNSGDYFVDEHVVEKILPEMDGTDLIQGNVIIEKDGKEHVDRGYGKSDITFIDVMCGNFLHLASFFRRNLFDKYGYFDESYRINSDTVFTAKCLGFGDATFKYVDQNITYYDITGISADPTGKYRKIREEEDARYAQMFSPRMWDLFHKEQKKIQLYDKLHAHKWSWWLTMAIAKLLK